jgi:1,4-alpha-glucan branching enzyme
MNSTSSANETPKLTAIAFTFEAPTARQVSLAGDFNNWDTKALPMRTGTDGLWHLRVPLKPGRHEYRFIADGVWQDDPAAEQRTANAWGGQNCVKVVAG